MEAVIPQLIKSHGEHVRFPYAYKRYKSGRLGAYFLELICYDEDRPTSRPSFLWGFVYFAKDDERTVERERYKLWVAPNWHLGFLKDEILKKERYDPVYLYRRSLHIAKYWYKIYAKRGYILEESAWDAFVLPAIKKPTFLYLAYEVRTGLPITILEAHNRGEALGLLNQQYNTKGVKVQTRLLEPIIDYYLEHPVYSKPMRKIMQ